MRLEYAPPLLEVTVFYPKEPTANSDLDPLSDHDNGYVDMFSDVPDFGTNSNSLES